MPTVSIVYHSGTGHTTVLAEAIAAGARSVPGTTVNLLSVEGKDIVEGRYKNEALLATLTVSDAIIFGSPTYMAGPSGQFKCFADATGGIWFNQQWKDKLAAGFSVSGTPSGDKLNTIEYFFLLSQQHSMVWIGTGLLPLAEGRLNRYGVFSGAAAASGYEPPSVKPDADDKDTGAHLGKRVAEAAARWTQ